MRTFSFAGICISILLPSASSSSIPQGNCTTGCAAAKHLEGDSLLLQVGAAEKRKVIRAEADLSGGGKRRYPKNLRIAIVGAGPAGIHMGSRLKQLGYKKVTIFEKTDRVGGKSFTLYRDVEGNECQQTVGADGAVDTASCVAHEMGTCFLHNGYHHTRDLLEEYGLQGVVSPEGRAVYWESPSGGSVSGEMSDFALAGIQKAVKDGHIENSMGMPDSVFAMYALLDAVARYSRLYANIFGDVRFTMPDRLSAEALGMINKPFEQFLQDNNLYALVSVAAIAHTAQGYGHISTIPAYYGLMWMKPEVLAGFVQENKPTAEVLQSLPTDWQEKFGSLIAEISAALGDSAGDDLALTTMIPEGYSKLWQRIYEQDQLDVRFNVKISRKGIRRYNERRGGVNITYSQNGGGKAAEKTETFDLLIYTAPHALAGKFMKFTKKERSIFRHLSQYILMTTLYESSPVAGYSDEAAAKAIMYQYPALDGGSEDDGQWYADRDDYRIFAKGGARQANGKQWRIAYQFYEEPCNIRRNHENALCDLKYSGAFPTKEKRFKAYKQPDELKRLKDVVRAKGSKVKKAEQFPWPYFWHFSQDAIAAGMPWDLLDMQGKKNTFWMGASAVFESVHDVVNYNLQLLDRHFGGQYQGDGAQMKAA